MSSIVERLANLTITSRVAPVRSISTIRSNLECIEPVCMGHQTQRTGAAHEQAVKGVWEEAGIESVSKERFKYNFLTNCDIGFRNLKELDFRESYPINDNEFDLEIDQTYFVHQPRGENAYPDFILFKISNEQIKMIYVECKQRRPRFNNTPPKNNDYCLYICGNNLYIGSELMNDTNEEAIREYYRILDELRTNFNNNEDLEYNITTLKAIECSRFPPSFFNKETNDQKIVNCLSHVIN
uniref:Uncharacterized protein n=1 Tax=Megaviridae environmental sample TaxID=1737588 RepID=A0A5J6VJY4_9VIRU|nr:MAG: hypothetical protein [Megaviridae environmental sample]